jgi:hypothetical protein
MVHYLSDFRARIVFKSYQDVYVDEMVGVDVACLQQTGLNC